VRIGLIHPKVEQLNKEGHKMTGRVSLVGDLTGIRLGAEFEFVFHGDIIALHVSLTDQSRRNQ